MEEATDAESRRRILALAQDPKIQAATNEMVEQTMASVVDTLHSEPVRKELTEIGSALTNAVVDEMLATLSSPRTQQKLAQATGALTRAAFAQTGDSLRRELGPAMRDVVRDDLAPAVQASLNEQMNQALGNTAHRVAYSAVLGANDGLGDALHAGVGPDLKSWSDTGLTWLRAGLIGLGLLTLALLSLAVMAVARARRARTDVQRLESATLLLATAMREKHESDDTHEIVEIVRTALADSAANHGKRRLLGALSLRH